MESMRIGYFEAEELEDKSQRKLDHRITHVKTKALGLGDLDGECPEAALEKKPLGPVLSQLLLLGVVVFCISA